MCSLTPLFHNLFDRQEEKGHHLSVYVPISYDYDEENIAASGDYTTIDRTFHQWERYIFHLKHYRVLKSLFNLYDFKQFDLVHAHSLFSNGWLAWKIHQKFDLPYVVAVRSADVRTFFAKAFWLRPLGQRILEDAEEIFFISANTYNEVFDRYIPSSKIAELKAKSHILPNGIEDFWHENKANHKSLDTHKPLEIVAVGKLLPEKGLPHLGDWVKRYHEEVSPAHLTVIGQNWNETIHQELLDNPVVTYLPPTDAKGLTKVYQDKDIFALLSTRETFGLVYVEAMSQGLPVLYTAGEGFDGYFPNHEIGERIDVHDFDTFRKGIERILASYPHYVHHALKESDRFDWDQITSSYLKLYEEVLNR